MKRFHSLGISCIISLALTTTPSEAILVDLDTNANNLANVLASGATGLTVTGSTLSGQSTNGAVSSGTYTNASGTYGIGDGVILSTGNVSNYGDGLNTSPSTAAFYSVPATAAQEALLDPITGGGFDHFDVTQLDIDFTTTTGEVFFDVVFGSEEYDEFVNSAFIDGFGLYLNGTNIAEVGGLPVNINHHDMTFLAGTELDGILAPGGDPLLTFGMTGLDTSSGHTLTFIVADTSDENLDTTVYLASLRGTEEPVPPEAPVPAAIWLFGSGLIGLYGIAWRKKTA
ncbi:MAG: choice-of-anchor L domain-containing protein [Pseudomonadota bacterium]